MLNIGPQELLIVLIIALVVVGPQRLPELGRTIGKVLREFRKIQDDVKDTLKFDLDDDPEPYVRPKKSPRPSKPEENGEATATDIADPAETTTSTDAETEINPEPRAAE
jgi:sec-independent protein translocase protein TatA